MSAKLAEAATQLSFAAFLERCIFVNAFPLHQLPVTTPPLDLRRLFHTPLPLGTFPQLSLSSLLDVPTRIIPRGPWLHLQRTMFSAPRVPDQSPRYFLMRQTPLHSVASHGASTQPPLTEFFIGCIFSNDPLDRQGLSSAHCNAGSASPPQPADIATLCSPSSTSHASDGLVDTTAPRVLP